LIDLGFRPRDWQASCFRALKRFSVLVVHRRGGKTVLAVMRLIDAALRLQLTMGYLAPQLKQAKRIALRYLKHYGRKIPGTTDRQQKFVPRLRG
jgi:phage terminase large subunit